MSEHEVRKLAYREMINQLTSRYTLRVDKEHEFIYEFFEGPLPVFKLLLISNDEGPGYVMMSFHIEVEACDAIQWFFRGRNLDPTLRVGPCYLRDVEGMTHVGSDAQILRLYMIEQDIISNFISGDKEPEEIIKSVVRPKPSPLKTYANYKKAINDFNKLEKKDGDLEH